MRNNLHWMKVMFLTVRGVWPLNKVLRRYSLLEDNLPLAKMIYARSIIQGARLYQWNKRLYFLRLHNKMKFFNVIINVN